MARAIRNLPRRTRYARDAFIRQLLDSRTRAGKAANALAEGYLIRLPHPPSALSEPRYGHGRPPHARLSSLLGAGDAAYEAVLNEFKSYTDDLLAIDFDKSDPREPHWRNQLLFGLDGVSLYCFTRKRAPRRYIEIGSGNSTLFVHRARRDGDIDMQIVSIDPAPRRDIDAISDTTIRQPLESIDLSVFADLREGDIVFLDGSHRAFMNSDVTVFFLDVLPELPPGVLVGVHDIHLPDDYLLADVKDYYSEQYLLACYLLAEASWILPVLPCWYVSHHPEMKALVDSLVPPYLEGRPRRAHVRAESCPHGVIFWLLTRPREERRAG
jgi:Methyltransferase domain